MPVFLYFLVYLFACLGIAIVIVPPIQPWLFEPIGLEPESSLYRFAMLSALLGMPFFLRYLGLNSWKSAGFTLGGRAAWAAMGKGLLVGIGIMIALTAAQWLLDIRHFAPPAHKWNPPYFVRTLFAGLIAGLAVGLIEETFFRGLLHTGMRRSLAFWPTATITALLYAALHFMKPESLGSAEFNSATALDSILTGLGRIGDFAPIADSFITLVVVGLFLSMVRERTGNIIWAIAIHAGWVMIIKLVKYLTDTSVIDGKASFWIGSYDYITGWMATLWLGSIAAIYWYRTRPKVAPVD
jgi:membrane protease YdiL (CAAX protease family)